ncbi:hypothetical protein ADP71_40850 [Vitreoscilla sp. C1]|nr:hypothetical protein ADP71_40850 [Vitreoscilla sp. C1]
MAPVYCACANDALSNKVMAVVNSILCFMMSNSCNQKQVYVHICLMEHTLLLRPNMFS